ncbi:TPA: hypothetical protein HA278_03855 [Candidatus Woesearchaeota archaeon]|nr:hypothetical protein [Candidatus Woesearchaeota archaeon]
MKPKYEEILDRMYFEIGSTLIDNDCCRKGYLTSKPIAESEILRSNRRTFMNLKVMMMRLERSLFGAQDGERPVQEIPDRNISKSGSANSNTGPI